MAKPAAAHAVDAAHARGGVEHHRRRTRVRDDAVLCGAIRDGEGVVCVRVERARGGERAGGRYGGVAKDDDDAAVVLVLDAVVRGVRKIRKVLISWVHEREGVERVVTKRGRSEPRSLVGDAPHVFELLRLSRGIGVFRAHAEERAIRVSVRTVRLDAHDRRGDDDDGILQRFQSFRGYDMVRVSTLSRHRQRHHGVRVRENLRQDAFD